MLTNAERPGPVASFSIAAGRVTQERDYAVAHGLPRSFPAVALAAGQDTSSQGSLAGYAEDAAAKRSKSPGRIEQQ